MMDIAELSHSPIGKSQVVRDSYDRAKNIHRDIVVERPYWVTSSHTNGTHMDKALLKAQNIIRAWINPSDAETRKYRNIGLPPIIIHITDGEHTGRFPPEPIANQIRSEGTQQGPNLIFTCHFTGKMLEPCIFPSHPSELAKYNDPFAPRMLEMSSIIPEPWLPDATAISQRQLQPGARAFIFNGSADLLMKFINWGSISRIGDESLKNMRGATDR